MKRVQNDRWRGEFSVSKLGRYEYTIEGWIDRFGTWRSDLVKRIQAGQDGPVDWLIGGALVEEVAEGAVGEDALLIRKWAQALREEKDAASRQAIALNEEMAQTVQHHPARRFASRYGKGLSVTVDRERAAFSTWYELFPRSCSAEPNRHGTLRDCEAWLPYVASMGFDVLYLPPVHPIGHTARKCKNNSITAQPDDVGSPWALRRR
jgi:starch synthase (maltosyl-transferring)